MSVPIMTSYLFILGMHRISLILWKKALPRGRDVGLRYVHEVWNPEHKQESYLLENCMLKESKANGHLSEGGKCPTKMAYMSKASDIKTHDPYQGWAFLSTVVAAIASLCIKVCPFMGLRNHVGKLAKWHSQPNREMGANQVTTQAAKKSGPRWQKNEDLMVASLQRPPVGGVVLDKEECPLPIKNDSWLIPVERILSTKVKALQFHSMTVAVQVHTAKCPLHHCFLRFLDYIIR